MPRLALRTLLAVSVAVSVWSVPLAAQEKADSTSSWVPDEVRASPSGRFT